VRLPVPKGFTRARVGATHLVAHESCIAWAQGVLEHETLYAWAARHPERHALPGRVPAYAVPLPNDTRRAVVRHGHHGGMLAGMLKDAFLPPTRAPYELLASYLLAGAGVPTPPVLAFAIYRAGWILRRSDFVTLALPGRDLGSALNEQPEAAARHAWLQPIGDLVRALTRAGAWHQDLNVRNILLVPNAEGLHNAFVLDVDRVRFAPPGDPNVRDANIARLERSVRKWRAQHGGGFDDAELRELRAIASAPAGA
jgi:3-deoxy-D-manno-octulosonic acid kinase